MDEVHQSGVCDYETPYWYLCILMLYLQCPDDCFPSQGVLLRMEALEKIPDVWDHHA